MCTSVTLYKTNTVCQKYRFILYLKQKLTRFHLHGKEKKKSHLKLVTLTAFRNTQTAHHQQNKPQDVSEKKKSMLSSKYLLHRIQSSLLVMTIHRISAMFS